MASIFKEKYMLRIKLVGKFCHCNNKAMHRKIKATRFVCTRASASNNSTQNTPLSFPVIAALESK